MNKFSVKDIPFILIMAWVIKSILLDIIRYPEYYIAVTVVLLGIELICSRLGKRQV